MALNIPLPSAPGEMLLKGVNAGSDLFTRIMQPVLEREKQKQLEEHFQAQLGLSKAAAGRAAQAATDAHKLALMKMDPNYAINQLKQKLEFINNLGVGQGDQTNTQQSAEQKYPDLHKMFMGEGVFPKDQESLGDQSTGIFSPQETAQMTPGIQKPLDTKVQGNPLLYGINFDELKRALTYQALGLKAPPQSGLAYTGPARHAIDLSRIKKEYGENSDEYLNAKAEYDASLEAKKDLRDIRERTKQGLKVGEKEFFDETTGVPLGKQIPLTAKERESEEGNILFNELYPYVYKGASPFSGEGSITRLQNAAAHYKTDPKARKLFDDYLLADKMMAATTVNEASTLKAGHTNQTYNRLQASLEAQDIPRIIKKIIKEYGVPSSAQLKAAMRYQKLLSDARIKARKSTPATQKLFYNPEMQAQHEEENNNRDVSNYTDDQKVKVDMGNGKIEIMTYKQAKSKGYA